MQGSISVLPRSDSVNLAFQRRVTRTLPRSKESFLQHVSEAAVHVDALRVRTNIATGDARVYEFGEDGIWSAR